jgi:hypothetical protein
VVGLDESWPLEARREGLPLNDVPKVVVVAEEDRKHDGRPDLGPEDSSASIDKIKRRRFRLIVKVHFEVKDFGFLESDNAPSTCGVEVHLCMNEGCHFYLSCSGSMPAKPRQGRP